MATAACIDVKDKSCIEVRPVDCIHETDEDRLVYIDPPECIDCGACVETCPVDAIFAEEDLPTHHRSFAEIGASYFKHKATARAMVDALRPR